MGFVLALLCHSRCGQPTFGEEISISRRWTKRAAWSGAHRCCSGLVQRRGRENARVCASSAFLHRHLRVPTSAALNLPRTIPACRTAVSRLVELVEAKLLSWSLIQSTLHSRSRLAWALNRRLQRNPRAWTWTVARCPICHQRSSACRATASCFCVCDTLLSLLARPQRARSWPHPAKHPPTDPMLVGSADTTTESLRDSQRQSSRKFKTAPLPCKDVSMISNQRTACAQSVCVHTSTVTSKVYYVSVSNSTSETTDQDSHRTITWCTGAHSVPWFHVVQSLPHFSIKMKPTNCHRTCFPSEELAFY